MTPAARVQAAIEVLDSILSGIPAEQALINWARRSRFAGSGDRAALRDHVFQALRCRRSYAAQGGALSGRGLMIGALRDQGLDPREIFTGQGYAPAALSEAESEAAKAEPTERDLTDLPDWLFDFFQSSLGEQAVPTALALRNRAPVVIRVNAARMSIAEAAERLAQDGIMAFADDIAPTALIVREGMRRIAAHELYLSGIVELQDGASQAAMTCVPVPEGGKVLDFCAGGGGKTLALSARAHAQWFAHDAFPDRLSDLPARARRAGVDVTILRSTELDATAPFDLVLCDVPCSGSGTWRRSPEAKWVLVPSRLQELTEAQAGILQQAARLVAQEGRLVYTTCSVLRCENEEQVDAFCTANPDWRCDLIRHWPVSEAGDGFFLAILKRENA